MRRPGFRLRERQFGYNCEYLALLPLPWERGRQLLVANHEYSDEELMFAGYDPGHPTREQVETTWAAHGMTVVALQENRRSGHSRRSSVTGSIGGSPLRHPLR